MQNQTSQSILWGTIDFFCFANLNLSTLIVCHTLCFVWLFVMESSCSSMNSNGHSTKKRCLCPLQKQGASMSKHNVCILSLFLQIIYTLQISMAIEEFLSGYPFLGTLNWKLWTKIWFYCFCYHTTTDLSIYETMIHFFSCVISFKVVLASLWNFKDSSKNDTLGLLASIWFTSIKRPPCFYTWNDDEGMLNGAGNAWMIYLVH